MKLPEKGVALSVEQVVSLCMNFGYMALAEFIHDNPPDTPFKSDGVSAIPGDIVGGYNLYEAAFWHDVRYWSGLKGDKEGRLKADAQFCIDCIELCGADYKTASAVFKAVRIGGSESLPTRWRWAFGRK